MLETGDIWYFPKGVAHNVQGLDDENEYLLAFDDGDFEKIGLVRMLEYFLAVHTDCILELPSWSMTGLLTLPRKSSPRTLVSMPLYLIMSRPNSHTF